MNILQILDPDAMTTGQREGPAARIIENLARKIDRVNLRAGALAEKTASPDCELSDFADYEKQAEKAQRLAGQQSNWEKLADMGFVK